MIKYLENLQELFTSMSFYMVIGLLCTGFLHAFVKEKWIKNQLGDKSVSSLFKAALVGVPLPLCSCGVIPMAVYLKQNNASKGAVFSFLSSTPQTGLDSIIATYGLLGPIFAAFRAVAAFASGIITGFVCEKLDPCEEASNEQTTCSCGCAAHKKEEAKHQKPSCGCGCGGKHEHQAPAIPNLSLSQKIKSMFHFAFVEFLQRIASHFVVGLLLAALISTLLPADLLASIHTPVISFLLVLIIGIPMYVCSTSSIPIAVSLIMKGLSPGAAFVFLVVGPATNAAALSILLQSMGKQSMAIYLASLSLCAIGFGLLLDALWGDQVIAEVQDLHCQGDALFQQIVAVIFALFLLMSLYRKYCKKS